MNERYQNGSAECDAIRQKAIDGCLCEMFSDYLESVIRFLNKKGYITKSQYETAIKSKLKSIHD